jgi:hypothetical protein
MQERLHARPHADGDASEPLNVDSDGSLSDGGDDHQHFSGTLRHRDCLRVEDGEAGIATFSKGICGKCESLPALRVLRKRVMRLADGHKAGPHSKTNFRYMNNNELVVRARHLQEGKRAIAYQVKFLVPFNGSTIVMHAAAPTDVLTHD